MSPSVRKALSVAAIVIASVAAGIVLTADLGWLTKTFAQQQSNVATAEGPIPAITLPSFADLADRVMPAVVSISTVEIVEGRGAGPINPFDFFFPDPRRPQQQPDGPPGPGIPQPGGGTGFIITEDGYILTNNHVVEGADRVQVRYGIGDNSRVVDAKVVGRDPSTDIALIKIDVGGNLPTLRLGDSDAARVGEWAIAIGNPFQFENSLTVGVVSGKGRSLGLGESSFEDFIQTDAAINSGNSGGPLLNIRGEVIGINTAIRAMAQGLGFATPINVAKRIYPQLRDQGRVVRGYIGIFIVDVDERTQQAFNLPNRNGALVNEVVAGQPAQKAGLRPGDVIIQIDDRTIRNNRDLIDYVSDVGPGKQIRIQYIREGQRRTTTATTIERPGEESARGVTPDAEADPSSARLGITVQPLTEAIRQQSGLDSGITGVVVGEVRPLSAAADGGLAPGDIITQVNGDSLESVDELRRVVEGARSGSYLRFYVRTPLRNGSTVGRFAIVQVP